MGYIESRNVKGAKEALRKSVPDLDINLEVRDITESRRAEDAIRRGVKELCTASRFLIASNPWGNDK